MCLVDSICITFVKQKSINLQNMIGTKKEFFFIL